MTLIISKVQQRESIKRTLGNTLPENFPKDDYEFAGEIDLKETIKSKKTVYKEKQHDESRESDPTDEKR